MANNVIKRIWNQNRMVAIEDLKGMTFQDESGGHTFQISGVDDAGNTVALTGSVAGVFLRPDNTDVAITGSASGGVVSVTLLPECYDVPGRFGLTIFVTDNGQKTAVYAAVGTVSRTSSGAVSPGTSADAVDLINRINAAVATIPASWTGLMADIAPTYSENSLYSVGAYAYYNGDLYRCISPITTKETWTSSHWTPAVLGQDVSDLKAAIKYSDTNINTSAGLWEINSDKSYDRIETKAWYHGFGYKVILTSSDYLLNVKAFDDYGNFVGYADTTNSNIISQSEGYFVSSQNPIDLTALASQYYLSFVIRKRVNGSNVPATTDDYVGIEIWKSVYEWQSEDDKIKANFVKTVNLFDKDSPLIKVNTYITGSAYASGDGYAASHPIPVEIGNTYKFPHGAGMGTAHRGFYVNDSGTYIDAFNTTIEDGFETFTATRTGYVAVNLGNGGYAETMFCVQNEYPNSFVPYGEKLSEVFLLNDKQIAEVKDIVNPLYGKTAVFDGDSICAANTNNERRGWALRIIEDNGMTGANVGVGGATITQGTQKSGVDRHWISAYIDTIHANYPALDYYIFDGGTNDADLFRTHPEKKGTFDPVDFSGNYDEETFCGAFESLIYKATSYYPSAKIGYIIPPKMGPLDAETGMTGYTAETNRRRAYFDTAIEICKKWGLPYIDLWDGCLMNPSLGAYYSPGTYYADGQHPTAIGYDLFTPMIDAWMKTL